MKKLLLLPIMICLLLAGCQPDDDVDFPEPQKPVSELIQGKWLYAPDSSYYYFADVAQGLTYDGIFFRPPTRLDEESGVMIGENAVNGSYTLTKSDGKTYVELVSYTHNFRDVKSKYKITTISDSKMLWIKESGTGADSLEFTKIKPTIDLQQPVSKLIQGNWYEISATYEDTYHSDFSSFPFTYTFTSDGRFYIFDETGPEGLIYEYTVTQQDGKNYIEYYDADPNTAPEHPVIHTFEIFYISDTQMTLKASSTNYKSIIIKLIRA